MEYTVAIRRTTYRSHLFGHLPVWGLMFYQSVSRNELNGLNLGLESTLNFRVRSASSLHSFFFLKLSRRYIQNPKKFKTIHLKQEVPRSLFSRSTSGAKCSETESCHKKHVLLWGYRVCTDVKWREIYQTIKGLWSKAPFCDLKFETKKLIDLMAGRCAFLEESCFFFGNYLDFFIFPSF